MRHECPLDDDTDAGRMGGDTADQDLDKSGRRESNSRSHWRERYGDEFAEVLGSSLSDGKGSRRLFFNVAQEGMVARLEEAGIVGRLAPPLQRARASVATILVGVLGSLGSAAVLTRYAKGWQRNPALESLTRAGCCWLVMSSSARCLRSDRSL